MKTLAELKAEERRLFAEYKEAQKPCLEKRDAWNAVYEELQEAEVQERVRVKLEELKK